MGMKKVLFGIGIGAVAGLSTLLQPFPLGVQGLSYPQRRGVGRQGA